MPSTCSDDKRVASSPGLEAACGDVAEPTREVQLVSKPRTGCGPLLRRVGKETEISLQTKSTRSFCGKHRPTRRAVGLWLLPDTAASGDTISTGTVESAIRCLRKWKDQLELPRGKHG